MFGRLMVVLAIQKTAKGNVYDISRPNTGVSFFDMEVHPAPPPPLCPGLPKAPWSEAALLIFGLLEVTKDTNK
jgi:hypothetical protein